jgi:hypothetical protein
MWYPEEPVTYCQTCDVDIPVDRYWRGRGFIVGGRQEQFRTTILYSQCPNCGRRRSVGLEGPLPLRILYGWLWKLRYPYTRPPEPDMVIERQRKRRAPES